MNRLAVFHFPSGSCITRRFGKSVALLATCFHAGFLLGLFFDPEDGGHRILRNVTWVMSENIEPLIFGLVFFCHPFLLCSYMNDSVGHWHPREAESCTTTACQSPLQPWVSLGLLYNQSSPGVRFLNKIIFYRMGLLAPCPTPIVEGQGVSLSLDPTLWPYRHWWFCW
jgi:hypothetical protein